MVLILHLRACFVWISGQMATFALYRINRLVLIMEAVSVSCLVHTKSYVKQICFIFKGLVIKIVQPCVCTKCSIFSYCMAEAWIIYSFFLKFLLISAFIRFFHPKTGHLAFWQKSSCHTGQVNKKAVKLGNLMLLYHVMLCKL